MGGDHKQWLCCSETLAETFRSRPGSRWAYIWLHYCTQSCKKAHFAISGLHCELQRTGESGETTTKVGLSLVVGPPPVFLVSVESPARQCLGARSRSLRQALLPASDTTMSSFTGAIGRRTSESCCPSMSSPCTTIYGFRFASLTRVAQLSGCALLSCVVPYFLFGGP